MDTNNQTTNSAEAKKVGPIIATLVIVLILVIGALYLFASKINQQALPSEAMMDNTATVTDAIVHPITNKSDTVKDLQKDLNMSTDGLDKQNF